MYSWHIIAEWFKGTEQVAPYPGARGFEYRTVPIWKRCGMVIRADTKQEAWRIFWAEYHTFSEDVRPWRNIRIAEKRER